MPVQTTGRPLDEAGEPTAGPALEIEPDGRAMELFAESPHALASSPGMGMWSTILRYPESNEAETPAMVVWLSPEATALPAHVHASRTEAFRPARGELTVVVDDTPHHIGTGEEYTVEPGDPHYFRNDTDDFVAFEVEVPWTRTIDTQYMTAGLDHEGYFGADGEYGEPDFVQGLLLAEYVSAETRIPIAPRLVQQALWATVNRIARLTGRRAMDERYLRDRFWESHVEQPDSHEASGTR
jgi:mannose-6-phosphate isomerase-like protein (cupin superfamily)